MGFIVPSLLGVLLLFLWNINVDGAAVGTLTRQSVSVAPDAAYHNNTFLAFNITGENETGSAIETTSNAMQNETPTQEPNNTFRNNSYLNVKTVATVTTNTTLSPLNISSTENATVDVTSQEQALNKINFETDVNQKITNDSLKDLRVNNNDTNVPHNLKGTVELNQHINTSWDSSKESNLDHENQSTVNNKFKSNVTHEENSVETNNTESEQKKDFIVRSDNSRSLDTKKYESSENNVFKAPQADQSQRFLSLESESKHRNKGFSSENDQSTERPFSTTLNNIFNNAHNDYKGDTNETDPKIMNSYIPRQLFDQLYDKPSNSTKTKLEITKIKDLRTNNTKVENGIYSSQVAVEKTSMNYHMTFNDTEIFDDDDDSDHDSKEEKDFSNIENSNSIKSGDSNEKEDSAEESNSKEIKPDLSLNITHKLALYDLPPKPPVLNKNESRASILTNSIIETKPKITKKDSLLSSYPTATDEHLNKENLDPYLLSDTTKPIIISKRGKVVEDVNIIRNVRNQNNTSSYPGKRNNITGNVSDIESVTLSVFQTSNKNFFNRTKPKELLPNFKKDMAVEPVTNNYINNEITTVKTIKRTTTTKIKDDHNTTFSNNIILRKNLATTTAESILANTTIVTPLINSNVTNLPLLLENSTKSRDGETVSTGDTYSTESIAVTSSPLDSTSLSLNSPVTTLRDFSSSSPVTITDDDDVMITNYTSIIDTSTHASFDSYSTVDIIDGSLNRITTDFLMTTTSIPLITEPYYSNSTDFDISEKTNTDTTETVTISPKLTNIVNVTLSKETVEEIDMNKDETESKEVMDDDDVEDIDDSTTTASPNDLLGIDQSENETWVRHENYTEERAASQDDLGAVLSSTISSTIEILHIASVGPHQTTFTPETFQPDHSYQTPELVESNDRSVDGISELDDLSEVTTVAGSHEMGRNDGTTIAAIVISCIGAVCLLLLAGLLVIIKRRHKRFNYGQRCTPVSLDSYSVDNVSVYNSVRRKGINRASKRSYGNPAFEDTCCTSNPLNFTALTKFAGNRERINLEFDEVPQIFAQMNELPEGCETKNRYANVIPLPETRTILTAIDGYPYTDYINANFVTGPKCTKGYYIACQGPLQSTVDDFWRMIWEQNSRLILMLTNLYENHVEKCADYLPPSEVLDCHRLFGDFEVTLKKREVKEKYVISTLQLKNMVSNSWREVTHMWYVGWPEKGVPMEFNSIIAFLIEARSFAKLPPTADNVKLYDRGIGNDPDGRGGSPVVVHCSPGTGRTGTVIACDMAIREFETSRQVDIPKLVYRIRRDRAGAVQTKDQYAFIYKVVSTYAIKLTGGVTLESI